MVTQVVSIPTHALLVSGAGFDGSSYDNGGAVARVPPSRKVVAATTHVSRVRMTWRHESTRSSRRCREWMRRRRWPTRSGPWWLVGRVTL